MEVVHTTASDMDRITTVLVPLVFSWKVIITIAEVKKMKGCEMLSSQILLVDINQNEAFSRNAIGSCRVSAVHLGPVRTYNLRTEV